MIQMDKATEAKYWAMRHYHAGQLEEFTTRTAQLKKITLREQTYSPYFAWDLHMAARYQAEIEADELHLRQWAKIAEHFEGYII